MVEILCRLCFSTCGKNNSIALFGDSGESNLIKLIAKYLYIGVTQQDTCSSICCVCSQNLDDFHKFFQYVEQRQIVLRNTEQNVEPSIKTTTAEDEQAEETQNLDESLLDLKEITFKDDDDEGLDKLVPQIEFGYASFDEDNHYSNDFEDNDEDDEPLQNLLRTKSKQKKVKSRSVKALNSSQPKKTKTGKISKKPKRKKTTLTKKCKVLSDNSNDSLIATNKSTKPIKKIYTPEEDKLNEDLIAKHMQLKCEICEVVVKTYKDLKVHFRSEHNCKAFVKCCGKRLAQRFLLVDHIKSHINPDHFKCKICGKVFKSRVCLSGHMANKHSDRDRLRHGCQICGKKFSHLSLLRTHMFVHTNERNHVCEICNKAFKSSHTLKAHTLHMHGEKILHVCETCGKEYRFKLSFDRHVAEHQGQMDQQEQCPLCGKWFSINYLKRHIKRHDLEDVDCEKCGRTFKSKSALAGHMDYTHKKKRIFSCTFCDKTFDRALNLKEHIDMHTGQKAWNCAHCPREFRSRANMYAHVKKMHYEQWAKAQLARNSGPVSVIDNKITKNAE